MEVPSPQTIEKVSLREELGLGGGGPKASGEDVFMAAKALGIATGIVSVLAAVSVVGVTSAMGVKNVRYSPLYSTQ